jgi:hypothetical protein
MICDQCTRPATWYVGALAFCTRHTSETHRIVPVNPPKTPRPNWIDQLGKKRESRRIARTARRRRAIASGLAADGKPRARDLPFLAIDGEGVGKPGAQRFILLHAGERELYRRGRTLHTQECLEFLLSLPAKRILIGFAFDYDATHILAELDPEQRRKLFLSDDDRASEFGEHFRYVHWKKYAIDYRPRQYLAVARLRGIMVQGKRRNYIVPGSTRTIYETHGNFQLPFVKALAAYEIGQEHLPFLAAMKARRGSFRTASAAVRRYNALECELLQQLMIRYREACRASNAMPELKWNGPAKIAKALMGGQAAITRHLDLSTLVPAAVLDMGRRAYYGGRAEISAIGQVSGPLWDYDRRSAYAAAVATLPCLLHGAWHPFTADPPFPLYVAHAGFTHPPGLPWCGLPFRIPGTGRLAWPRHGGGTYWSCEIEAARAIGATVRIRQGWAYERTCDCQPFAFVRPLYSARHAGVDGAPVKRALAAIYGQLVRRKGGPGLFQNYLWGGLVTAATRASLLHAIAAAADPASIVMLATDGLVSRERLAGLPIGSGLGDWRESGPHDGLFIVQPGLYWGRGKRATKGMSATAFSGSIPAFEAAWQAWLSAGGPSHNGAWWRQLPSVPLALETFISLRQGSARGKPETSGRWEQIERQIDFRWHNKREYTGARQIGNAVFTLPLAGASGSRSADYSWQDDTVSEAEALELLTEGLPDALDWQAPGF